MYNVRGKLLSGITSMHIDSSACVRVKGGESERFKIDSGVRQGCIISPWMFNIYIYMDGLLGGQGAYTHVILVLRVCIWNAHTVSLVLPAFDDTGSLGTPPRQVVYPPV